MKKQDLGFDPTFSENDSGKPTFTSRPFGLDKCFTKEDAAFLRARYEAREAPWFVG
jgi:hypothetical protein